MSTPSDAVSTYILAKDGNRPFLMRRAFAETAELEMVVKTDAISFPSSAKGVSAIEDILVRRVGMSAKNNGQVRVGCGRYDWYFGPDKECHVERLVIVIDVMKIFPAVELAASMNWLSSLPYPWCAPDEPVRGIPATEGFAEIETYLKRVRPILQER